MNEFRKRFTSNEVKEVLTVLNEISSHFQNSSYEPVQKILEDDFLSKSRELKRLVKQGVTPRVLVLQTISNLVGYMVTSGEYDVYRSALTRDGEDLLKIFDYVTDKLVEEKVIKLVVGEEQKNEIRKNIKDSSSIASAWQIINDAQSDIKDIQSYAEAGEWNPDVHQEIRKKVSAIDRRLKDLKRASGVDAITGEQSATISGMLGGLHYIINHELPKPPSGRKHI